MNKRLTRYLCIGLLALLVFTLAAGCSRQSPVSQDQALIDAQVYVPETVYIGGVLPLSGAMAEQAENTRAAWEVAGDIINNQHDLDWDLAQSSGIAAYGHARLALVYGDSAESVLSAARAAEDLIDQGVVALAGAYHTDHTAAAAQRAHIHKLPMVCGSAKTAKLTDGTSYDFAKDFNRLAPTDVQESQQFFAYLKHLNQTQNAGISKIAIAYMNNTYGQHVLGTFNPYAEQYGFQVVAREVYEPDTENVAVEVEKMISNSPDAIFQASSLQDLILFAKAYGDSEYQPQAALCYSGGFQSGEFARAVGADGLDYFAGTMIVPLPNSGQAAGGGQALVKEADQTGEIFRYINSLYKKKTGKDMDSTALLEFSSIIVLAQAVAAAGSTDGVLLSQILKDTVFDAPYLYGNSVDFDDLGQNTVFPGYMVRIVGGQYEKAY